MRIAALIAIAALAAGEDKFASLGKPTEYMQSTSPNGYRLAIRRWPAAAGTFKASIVLQHGGGWHSGYFGELGTALSRKGYEVVAMDTMGHGFSEGPGGKLQWDHLRVAQEDLRQLVASTPKPVVLFAESMGAVIGTTLAIENLVDAYVASGGLFQLEKKTAPPALATAMLVAVGWLFPDFKVTLPSLNDTFDSAFGDPRWAQAARADPNIVVNAFYAGSMSQVLREARQIRRKASSVTCPLLVMHSKADTRTAFAAAETFFQKVASTDKRLIAYDNASHQLYQDTEANVARTISDFLSWLEEHYGEVPVDDASDGDDGDAETSAASSDSRDDL